MSGIQMGGPGFHKNLFMDTRTEISHNIHESYNIIYVLNFPKHLKCKNKNEQQATVDFCALSPAFSSDSL
jgi:hypothetical protein